MRIAWFVLVGVRVLAALAFLVGPWTDEPAELAGWDAARFQAIADEPGRYWVDHAVEYPPGSAVLIEVLTAGGEAGDVVRTNRLLVVASLVVDLGIAALLTREWGQRQGLAYLGLGLLMVPSGLLRFDLWAALALTLALIGLRRRSPALTAVGIVIGTLIKVWPALLIPLAFAAGRRREAAASLAGLAGAALLWIGYGGYGAIDQVTSLRGATGWHVESVFGSLTALFTDAEQRFEFDVYRIGTLSDSIVLAGRVATLAVTSAMAHRLWRRHADGDEAVHDIAVAMLASTAALIVTAPLLSPQFLLWLTPMAALAWPVSRQTVFAAGAAIGLTAVVLAIFGPPNLSGTVPATALLVRDGAMLIVIILAWRALSPSQGTATSRPETA